MPQTERETYKDKENDTSLNTTNPKASKSRRSRDSRRLPARPK